MSRRQPRTLGVFVIDASGEILQPDNEPRAARPAARARRRTPPASAWPSCWAPWPPVLAILAVRRRR